MNPTTSTQAPTPIARGIAPASGTERRRFERFDLPSMYTEIKVRELDSEEFELHGHAYDVSLGGIRFELDTPLEPGTRIAVQIQLPGSAPKDRRAIFAFANVVRIYEDDIEARGPVRIACVFENFCTPDAEARLTAALSSGRFTKAA
jgi:hypothetical protein